MGQGQTKMTDKRKRWNVKKEKYKTRINNSEDTIAKKMLQSIVMKIVKSPKRPKPTKQILGITKVELKIFG